MTGNRLLLASLCTLALGAGSGCTVVKPVIGAVTGPVVLFASTGGHFCGCGDGRAVLCLFAFASAIGAAGGLVTGIISDVNVLCGYAEDPCRNLFDPFAVNTGPCR